MTLWCVSIRLLVTIDEWKARALVKALSDIGTDVRLDEEEGGWE